MMLTNIVCAGLLLAAALVVSAIATVSDDPVQPQAMGNRMGETPKARPQMANRRTAFARDDMEDRQSSASRMPPTLTSDFTRPTNAIRH